MTTINWVVYWCFAAGVSVFANWVLRPKNQIGWHRNKVGLFLVILFVLFAMIIYILEWITIKYPDLAIHERGFAIMALMWVWGAILEIVSRAFTKRRLK